MDQEMKRPMPESEEERCKAGMPREKIAEERIWNKRPDGLAIKMPTSAKMGEFVILDFKRMSDVTDQYMTRAKQVASSIRVHKVGTRTNAWPTRMVGEPETLHSRSTISK